MEDVSLSFYHYMCKNVVGTENHVKTIRLMNTIYDNISGDDSQVYITSGSFGEGLDMRGSDTDVMIVSKHNEIYDTLTPFVFNPTKTYFSLMTEDTKPGFAMLRLIYSSPNSAILQYCEHFRRDNYLSNALLKRFFLKDNSYFELHGPCISDKGGLTDLAPCLHCKSWVTPAFRWTMRSNNSWPNGDIKQMIINHGVLFVPIGAKGSPHEDLEWRISFSVGEKLLIYTFSHTQLLCYSLMKILLKDVINTDSRCKDLLCSYYLKTIIFWVSEELQPLLWTPNNLIPCFMRCFSRLIYCVQYSVCPHYFIPEHNLFENKIEGLDRKQLIDTLRVLFTYGWRSILFSDQISHVSILSCNIQNDHSLLYYEDYFKLLKSKSIAYIHTIGDKHYHFMRAVHQMMFSTSSKLKYMHAYFVSAVCNNHCQTAYMSSTISNKNQYKQYNTCMSYLLMNINHDAVSGWLMLASYFYNANQYKKSLIIIVYALSKCTLEKHLCWTEMSVTQRLLVKRHLALEQGVVRSLKLLHVDCVVLSTFIPMELLITGACIVIPPVVYAHFLSFLCYYNLNDVRECRNSLRDLKLTIAEDYFIEDDDSLKASSYYCLGTALQLTGDNVSAKKAFTVVKNLFPYPSLMLFMERYKRLSLIASS